MLSSSIHVVVLTIVMMTLSCHAVPFIITSYDDPQCTSQISRRTENSDQCILLSASGGVFFYRSLRFRDCQYFDDRGACDASCTNCGATTVTYFGTCVRQPGNSVVWAKTFVDPNDAACINYTGKIGGGTTLITTPNSAIATHGNVPLSNTLAITVMYMLSM